MPPGIGYSDADIDLDDLGLERPIVPEFEDEAFDPGAGGMLLEALFSGMRNAPRPRLRGFGENVVGGLVGGLATRGGRVASARERFGERQKERRRLYDNARMKAQQDYETRRETRKGELWKEHRAKLTKEQEREFDNPRVTEAHVKINPELASILGEPMPRASLQRALRGEKIGDDSAAAKKGEGREARAEARESRMEAAERRAADAAERQARLGNVQTVNQLASAYKEDRAIKGYEAVRSNLTTARTASREASGFGDVAMIFSFMRAMEPENVNVVREGEFTNAENAVGALQKYKNTVGKYVKGTRLTPEGRQYLLRTMESTLASRRPDFDVAVGQYRRRAESGGVDPSLFIREYNDAPDAGDAEYNRYLRMAGPDR